MPHAQRRDASHEKTTKYRVADQKEQIQKHWKSQTTWIGAQSNHLVEKAFHTYLSSKDNPLISSANKENGELEPPETLTVEEKSDGYLQYAYNWYNLDALQNMVKSINHD